MKILATSFNERALLAIPTFTLTEGITSTLTNISRKVVGIPLEIELAASRVKNGHKRPLLDRTNVDKCIAACLVTMSEVTLSDADDEGPKM